MTNLRIIAVAGLALVVVGCGVDDGGPADQSSISTTAAAETTVAAGTASRDTADPVDLAVAADVPPDVVVTRGEFTLSLRPTTYCWTPVDAAGGVSTVGADGEVVGICSDGVRPESPAVLGGEGSITIGFPASLDFQFGGTAWDESFERVIGELTATTTELGRVLTLPAGAVGAGPLGVDVFGSGPAGDVFVSFLVN